MKRWFCFLLVCWGVVFLLLHPGHQAGVHHQLHASCDGSVNCWREFVPTSIRTLPATSIAFVRSRAGPLKSLVACWALLTPADGIGPPWLDRSEEHTSELQSQSNLVCRLLLEKK